MFGVVIVRGDIAYAKNIASECGCEVVSVEDDGSGCCRMGLSFDNSGLVRLALEHARGVLDGERFRLGEGKKES